MNNSQKDLHNQIASMFEKEEREELEKNINLIKEFCNFSKSHDIELSPNNFRFIRRIGLVAEHPNIVLKLNTNLKLDKEGLFLFQDLEKYYEKKFMCSGLLFDHNYILLAHPYFRRSFHESNNFAPRFIESYWGINDVDIDKYIALDLNRVRINVNDSVYIELDTWYGAKFNKDISKIKDGLVKLVPPPDLNQFRVQSYFGGVHTLNIKWYSYENIKVFQLEEFKVDQVTLNLNAKEYHPAKYLHAEYDSITGSFRHFDGALHLYTNEEYYSRRDSDFNHDIKDTTHIKPNSIKLFKINGDLSVKNWVELTSQFLTGNPLIHEYFEGQLPERINRIIEVLRNTND